MQDPSPLTGVDHRKQQEGFEAVHRTTYLTLIFLMALPAAALAQDRGSADDQMACTPDVYRLCSGNIPDEDAITVCLQQHKAQLSPACKAVFSRPSTPKPKDSDDD
jgi:hypothetical protein